MAVSFAGGVKAMFAATAADTDGTVGAVSCLPVHRKARTPTMVNVVITAAWPPALRPAGIAIQPFERKLMAQKMQVTTTA